MVEHFIFHLGEYFVGFVDHSSMNLFLVEPPSL